MNTLTVTLSSLVDRTLLELLSPAEVSMTATLVSSISAGDTTFQLTNGADVNPSDIIEFGDELVLVTGKTADPTPSFTVQRAYFSTIAASHATTVVGYVNPRHPRIQVAEAIRRCFPRLEALGLPMVKTETFNTVADASYIVMPENTRKVLQVVDMLTPAGPIVLDRWRFWPDAPTVKFPTGRILRVGRYVMSDDDLEITYQVPYRWSNHPTAPISTSTIDLMEGSEDLPPMYASAWQLTRREISRQALELAQEWNQGEPSRSGVSAAFVRMKWQNFYQALDEARRLTTVPLHRPFIKTPKVWG